MINPIQVIDGIIYHAPLVREMDRATGDIKDFCVSGRDPREVVHVMGYDGRFKTEFFGAFPLGELDDAIQGWHNSGYPLIYVVPTGKIGQTERVLAQDRNVGVTA